MQQLSGSSRLARRSVLGGVGAFALSGCFGSFGAVRALWEWNDDVHESKWVKWLVFLGLSIIPVYGLFAFADVLVLNSIEFWTGKNPVRSAGGGRTVARVATSDPSVVRLEVRRGEVIEQVAYFRRLGDEGVQILDAEGLELSIVEPLNDGGLELRARGRAPVRLDHAAVQRASDRVRQGEAAHLALASELRDTDLRLSELALPEQR